MPEKQTEKGIKTKKTQSSDGKQQIKLENTNKVVESSEFKQTVYHVAKKGENLYQISSQYNAKMTR